MTQTKEENKYALPTTLRPVLEKDPNSFILYAAPKIGKTTFCAQLQDSLLLDLEKGARKVSGNIIEVNSYEDLRGYAKSIKEAGKPYKYITIDTITKLEEWCEWEATKDYMSSPIGVKFNRDDRGVMLPRSEWVSVLTLPKGAGYWWLRESFAKTIAGFLNLTPHLIMIAHIKDTFLMKQGTEVSYRDLDLTGKIRGSTAADADAIGYMYRKMVGGKSTLRISFKDNDDVLCGSRCEHLVGQDIEADWSKIFIE